MKYLEGKLNDGINSVNNLLLLDEVVIKFIILIVLNFGLFVQVSGVGLNGLYVLNLDCNIYCDKQKVIIIKEVQLRNIILLVN